MWQDDPATAKQLAYLKKFGYTATVPLTKEQAGELLDKFQDDPERLAIREKNDVNAMDRQLRDMEVHLAYSLHKDVKDAIGEPDDLECAVGCRMDFWENTFDIAKCGESQEMDLCSEFGRFFQPPTKEQIQAILDALDKAMPTWDKDHCELFYQTLELNHPELKST